MLTNEIITKKSVDILSKRDITDVNDDDMMSINTTGKWVKTRSSGQNYQYYKYNNGGGKAREIYMEKTVKSYNKNFDKFTRDVDAIKSFETGILKDLLVIGVLDHGYKTLKNPSVANVKKFLSKYLKSIPGVGVIVSFISYMNLVNKALDSYKKIPATEKRWR